MASIRGFCRFLARPAALALFLAIGGAFGLAPRSGGAAASTAVVVDLSPSCEPPRPGIEGALSFAGGNGSAALARAAARGSADRIRLYTDAVFDRLPALPGKPVDVVLRPRRDDAGILELRLPAGVAPGADFAVEVVVGRTVGKGAPVEVVVGLRRDGERIGAARKLVLRRGARVRVAFRDRVGKPGLYAYRAEIAGGPGDHPVNDRRGAILRAGKRPVVLVVGPTALDRRFHTIRKSPAEVEAFLGDPAVAASIDAIWIGEPLVPQGAQQAVVQAVFGGAGLVLSGGDGYAGRPLEKILPLTDRPPGGRATVLLLDFSGSMAPLLPRLETGVRRLLAAFAPGDRVALIAFRAAIVFQEPFRPAAAVRWERNGGELPQGNTMLAPALRRARELLAGVRAQERRIFLVSDGEWKDPSAARLLLESLGDIRTAVLYVGEGEPHSQLFDAYFTAGDDLPAALESMERRSPGRRLPGPLTAAPHDVAGWLRGALPQRRRYPGAVRLFPRAIGERLALLDSEGRPLLATLEPGGRVVVAALEEFSIDGLVAACVRVGGGVGLTLRREGADLILRARGKTQLPFVVGGQPVASRPVGPRQWGARVPAPPGGVQVRFGSAIALAPPAAFTEHAGLANRPDLAARIAQLSGGRFYPAEPAGEPDSGGRPAAYLLLLLAAGCVVWSAVVRRAA